MQEQQLFQLPIVQGRQSNVFDTPQTSFSARYHNQLSEQNLIDWINSFDDAYCVLVCQLPDDMQDGVVVSHLVGNIACSQADRVKIFDLLHYPLSQETPLQLDQIIENFDLAYNVLKYSQCYTDQNKRFLEDFDAQNFNLMSFIQGLYEIDLTLRKPGIPSFNQSIEHQES